MQYLVIFNPKKALSLDALSPEAAAQHRAELAQGRVLYGQGSLRQSWEIATDRHGAVCIFEADSPEALQAMIDSFPYVAAGVVETQTIPLKPDGGYVEVD